MENILKYSKVTIFTKERLLRKKLPLKDVHVALHLNSASRGRKKMHLPQTHN